MGLQKNLFGQLAQQLPRRVEGMLRDASDATIVEVGVQMNAAKSGAQYPDLPRRSSAPGEAPANQSGDLESSYQTVRLASDQVNAESDSPYALIQELGSIDGTTLAPRPALAPATETAGKAALERALHVILTEHPR